MERLLARLERRFGRYAIDNLISYIVGGMALVWVLANMKPGFGDYLVLDTRAVARGQVWRLVTFLFLPTADQPLWVILTLYFTWWVGSSLEQHWGAFKFNAFYLVATAATIVAAALTGPQTNMWIGSSLMLAFATLFPDVTILLFFVLPVRVKWLGILGAVTMIYEALRGRATTRGGVAAALVAYIIFFAGHWLAAWRGRKVVVRQRERRESSRPTSEPSVPVFGQRVCAICGAREADGVDIRVCSCEKCGGQQRALCLAHARNH